MISTRPDPFVRLAHVVGNFGNPFYAEERQRDVWNEASAFGFQLVLWCALVVSTGAVWVVGATAVPYACVAMLLVGLLRAQEEPLEPSTLAGMATGAAVGVLAAVLGLRRSRRP